MKSKTLQLNKYDFKDGVNKFFTDADLSLDDFKAERQKDIAEADIVLFNGLGVDDVPLGGRLLKDVHGTSFYTDAKNQKEESCRLEKEKKDANFRNIMWVLVTIALLLLFNR